MLYIKSIFVLLLLSTITLTGCLQSSKQVYTFELTNENEGTLTIDIYDIHSNVYQDSEEKDKNIKDDFITFIDSLHNGAKFENNFPNALLVSKSFYPSENKLCAKYIFKFSNKEDVYLYKFEKDGPYLYYYRGNGDQSSLITYGTEPDPANTNGILGTNKLPIVYWANGTTKFILTYLTSSETGTENINLLKMYNKWKK